MWITGAKSAFDDPQDAPWPGAAPFDVVDSAEQPAEIAAGAGLLAPGLPGLVATRPVGAGAVGGVGGVGGAASDIILCVSLTKRV